MGVSLVHVPDVSGEGVPGQLLEAERARLLGLPGRPGGPRPRGRLLGCRRAGLAGGRGRADLHARGRGRRGQGLQHGLDVGLAGW